VDKSKSGPSEAASIELSRRSFLKQSSLLGALASVGGRIGALTESRGDSGYQGLLPQTGDRPKAPVFPRGPGFPRGAVIRTLLKDLPPQALASGAVLFHEHAILVDNPRRFLAFVPKGVYRV
jgi:hypothetical protein